MKVFNQLPEKSPLPAAMRGLSGGCCRGFASAGETGRAMSPNKTKKRARFKMIDTREGSPAAPWHQAETRAEDVEVQRLRDELQYLGGRGRG
jgi:hypothetical protein